MKNFEGTLRRVLLLMGVLIASAIASSSALAKIRHDSIRWDASVLQTVSTGSHTPFWMVSNRQGLGNVKKQFGYVRVGAFRDMDTTRRFTWGAGADIVAGWNLTAPFRIQQLYGEIKYRCLQGVLGSKETWGCFNDPRLSSGNLLYSGNAMPVPQIKIGILDYADIWGLGGWLGLKGYFAFGMFTDGRWQKSYAAPDARRTEKVLYHSKGLWLRNGNINKFPLQFEAGIEMATQFGGRAYNVFETGDVLELPSGLKDWWKAVVPLKGGSQSPSQDQTNIQGNMLGSWNFRLSWLPKQDWSVMAYYQHFFEDHSMLYIEYPWKDGLLGVQATFPKNRFVTGVVYEYLNHKDQTGPVYWDHTDQLPTQVSGTDNYYNHFLYTGWQNWGMGIGNPLSVSPLFNADGTLNFRHTRIEGHHLGLCGDPCSSVQWRMLMSLTRSWGTYQQVQDQLRHDFSAMLEVTWRPQSLKGWRATFSVAGDAGGLLGNSFGVMLSVGKTGWISW